LVQATSPLMSGIPELLLLRLLSQKPMYGYELARAIRSTTREAISVGEGVLYPALHTLERRGWLKARRRAVGGRTRVYYSLTNGGKRHLQTMTRAWRRISGGVDAALLDASRA
jgi:PadR family transcriptional regulator, regulatory protein PadR